MYIQYLRVIAGEAHASVMLLCAVPGEDALLEIPAINVVRVLRNKDKVPFEANKGKMNRWAAANVRLTLKVTQGLRVCESH